MNPEDCDFYFDGICTVEGFNTVCDPMKYDGAITECSGYKNSKEEAQKALDKAHKEFEEDWVPKLGIKIKKGA